MAIQVSLPNSAITEIVIDPLRREDGMYIVLHPKDEQNFQSIQLIFAEQIDKLPERNKLLYSVDSYLPTEGAPYPKYTLECILNKTEQLPVFLNLLKNEGYISNTDFPDLLKKCTEAGFIKANASPELS